MRRGWGPPNMVRDASVISASRWSCSSSAKTKIGRWSAVLGAEFIQPPDGLAEYSPIEQVRIVAGDRRSLFDSDIEHEPVDCSNLVEQAIRELAEFGIGRDVPGGVQARTLFLPQGGVLPGLGDFVFQQLALSLKEPCRKPSDLVEWQDDVGKTEYRAVIVLGMRPGDVRADMPELVEICDIGHRFSAVPDARKPAPERGPRNEGKLGLRFAGKFRDQ